MLSLDTSKKLKDAGLEWEHPQIGDMYSYGDSEIFVIRPNGKAGLEPPKHLLVDAIWLPSLSQLLAEIVIKEWGYRLSSTWVEDELSGFECLISRREEIKPGKWKLEEHEFRADSPEEAAAQALLWILKS
jgi:hypothetical protein